MRLPKQARPVMRKGSTAGIEDGVSPSFLCKAACSLLPVPANLACMVAC